MSLMLSCTDIKHKMVLMSHEYRDKSLDWVVELSLKHPVLYVS